MATDRKDSFGARSTLKGPAGGVDYIRLAALEKAGIGAVDRLPFSLRILLENLLRNEDGRLVRQEDVAALARWEPASAPSREVPYLPARVLLQDFTGVPAVVDLAAMRDAMRQLGGEPKRINPQIPADLVIDHSVQVDAVRLRRGVPHQWREGVRAQRRALRLLALGAGESRELPRRAAGDRHLPPGQPRVPGTGGVRARRRRAPRGLPRQLGRDRFAHHHDQRRRRLRLGRRRHRGGSRDARATVLHADAAGGRVQAGRRAAGGRDRHRSRPHHHPDPAQARRGREVRRVLRPRPEPPRLADRATIANMAPEYGATMGFFPVDARTLELPAAHRPQPRSRGSRGGVLQGAGAVPHRRITRAGVQREPRSSTSGRSCRAWPVRSGRRTGWRCRT